MAGRGAAGAHVLVPLPEGGRSPAQKSDAPSRQSSLWWHAADRLSAADLKQDECIDYVRTSFSYKRPEGQTPLRVRAREFLCGSGAFFSLFGWRFLRRSLSNIWKPQLLYTVFAAFFVAYMEAIPPASRARLEKAIHSFALLFDFTRVFLVFTLTAVVGTMYNRWWQMRQLIGTVMGRTHDTTIVVVTFIHGDDTAHLRCDLVRYLNLAHVLVHMQARSKHGKETLFTLDELRTADLLTENEEAILRSHQNLVSLHSVVYTWFLQLWLEALREGLVPSIVASSVNQKVLENVGLMRGAAADIFMYQSTPPPVGYFRVLYLLLNVSLFISPLGVYATMLDKSKVGHDRWMVVPVVFVITFFLLSFIHMCHEMFDPFAEGLSHFPLRHYVVSTMRASFALLEMPREGRMRYYSAENRPRAPTQFEASAEAAGDCSGSGVPERILEEEQQLHISIVERCKSTGSMNLLGAAFLAERSEQDALRDLQEGRNLLSTRRVVPLAGEWPGALAPHGAASAGTERRAPRGRSISSIV